VPPRRSPNVATIGGDKRIGQVLGRPAANEAMSAAVGIARECGATVTSALLVEGEPAEALLDIAAERHADLIVIGG
jgi:nucleotide-binding universal stress UspA family protein